MKILNVAVALTSTVLIVGSQSCLVQVADAAAIVPVETTERLQDDLPTAEKIVAKYIEAIGGKEKNLATKTLIVEGKIEIPQAGIEGTMRSVQAAPNKMMTIAEIPGVGNEMTGFDGKTAWQNSGVTGPKIMDGEQKIQFMTQADINMMLHLDKHFDKVECKGKEKFSDEDCYVVVASKEGVSPLYNYFSVESGLLVGNKQNVETGMGKMEITTKLSDYKEVDGIKFSMKAVQEFPNGMSVVITSEKIDRNKELEKDAFEIPDDVKELIK